MPRLSLAASLAAVALCGASPFSDRKKATNSSAAGADGSHAGAGEGLHAVGLDEQHHAANVMEKDHSVTETRHAQAVESAKWGFASIAFAVIVAVLCVAGQGSCAYCAVKALVKDLAETDICREMAEFLNPVPYHELGDSDGDGYWQSGHFKRTIIREMRLMVLTPLLPLVALPWTTCEGGAPIWLYVAYVPLLVRAKVIEARLLRKLGAPWSVKLVVLCFILGAHDHVDYFTDGVFPLQALKCEEERVTERYAATFRTSALPWAEPLVATLRFHGAAYLLLAAATLGQQAMGAYFATDGREWGLAVAADVPGFRAVASLLDGRAGEDQGGAALFVSVSKVLLENAPQLYLQAAFYALTFNHTTDGAKRKQLASLALGLVAATHKATAALRELWGAPAHHWEGRAGRIRRAVFAFQFVTLGVVATTIAKLVSAHRCPSHLWNLSTLSCASPELVG